MRESVKQMGKELAEYRRKYKRVSNAHMPHLNRSEAQSKLAQYGKKNAANYEEDGEKKAAERKRERAGSNGLLARAAKVAEAAGRIGLSTPAKHKDHTADKCGTCGSTDIEVRIEAKRV